MTDYDMQQAELSRNQIHKYQQKSSSTKNKLTIFQICTYVLGFLILIALIYALNQYQRQISGMRQKQFIDQQYDVELPQHTLLEQARPKDQSMILYKIIKTNSQPAPPNTPQACTLISSTNLVTKTTINTVIQLLKTSSIRTVFLMVNLNDLHSNHIIKRQLQQDYIVRSVPVIFSDMLFAGVIKEECARLVYLFGNFLVTEEMAGNIAEEVEEMRQLTMYYTTNYELKSKKTQLPKLETADLSTMQPLSFYSYLYILDTQFFSIITPTNFGYYAKYTLQQMLLIPNLVLFQNSLSLYTNDRVMHGLGVEIGQFRKVAVDGLGKQREFLCFVSYPVVPDKFDYLQANIYLKSIAKQNLTSPNSKPSVILYAPYNPATKPNQLLLIAQQLLQMLTTNSVTRAKLRITPHKVSSTYAVYQSVYTYCPDGALAITSRHNVKFHRNMTQEILENLYVKYHYYYFDVVDQGGRKVEFNQGEFRSLKKNFNQVKDMVFQDKLRHVQVFKTDLMKMVPFWILKSSELDFFETEIPFVYNMLQVIAKFEIRFIEKTLAMVTVHNISQKQQNQIDNFKHYTSYHPLTQNYLIPIKYNCLHNPAFQRNAPFKIPANIHQIWLGKGNITPIRMKLFDSIVQVNKNFTVNLWRSQNVTKLNFPITFNLLNIVSQKHKTSVKSIYAMAADMLRYQVLLNFGGIYMDFKFQGHKPMDNFRKYQLIFADLDIADIRFGSPKAAGNPFMAATPNNYHLKMTLTELVNQRTINFWDSLPFVTGGFALRKSLTDFELYTQTSYGQHLTIPNPYQEAKDYCGGINRNFAKQEQIFQLNIDAETVMKVGVPCNRYELSYLVLVSPLSKTWLKKKEDAN